MDATALSADTLTAHSAVLIYFLAVLVFAAGGLVFWWLIRPQRASEEKLTTYECGEDPQGSAWVQFNIRFYVFALIFVVFDVEAVFLFPWAVAYNRMQLYMVLEGVLFLLILAAGLLYAWRKGALEWV